MVEAASAAFDARTTPARPDLAAMHLVGRVQAARFVEGRSYEVVAAQAPVRHAPSSDALLDTEALRGERVTIYEMGEEGWAWGQLEADGYVGFLPSNALREPSEPPTHKVIAVRTLLFAGASIKFPSIDSLPFGCQLAITRTEGHFAVTASGGYVPYRHLAPPAKTENDFVAAAERFVGSPYLWGGKTNLGIDCSALVQVALGACGIACPRDSDMQEKALGAEVPITIAKSHFRRGDLVFWNGHVAIVRDEATLIHANSFHMCVAIEPITDAVARFAAAENDITRIRRITPLG
jgi:cell wall-associated NlpC family hydrolase